MMIHCSRTQDVVDQIIVHAHYMFANHITTRPDPLTQIKTFAGCLQLPEVVGRPEVIKNDSINFGYVFPPSLADAQVSSNPDGRSMKGHEQRSVNSNLKSTVRWKIEAAQVALWSCTQSTYTRQIVHGLKKQYLLDGFAGSSDFHCLARIHVEVVTRSPCNSLNLHWRRDSIC